MFEIIERIITIAGSTSEIISLIAMFRQRAKEKHTEEPVDTLESVKLDLTPEELEAYQELILISAILLLIEQSPSGSWGATMDSFVETYLRTYSTKITPRPNVPDAPLDSPTFQRYAIEGLQAVFSTSDCYSFAHDASLKSVRNRLGSRGFIVKSTPPTGQTGLPKYYIDYHHTVTAAHSYLLATGRVSEYPLQVLRLLTRHRELWYALYDVEERDKDSGRSMSNLAGVHMSDSLYFLSDMAELLPVDDHYDDQRMAATLRNEVSNALLRSQDRSDGLWGYPEHARLLRTLWVLENISKSRTSDFNQTFSRTVREFCEERDLFNLELLGQPLVGDVDPDVMKECYRHKGKVNVPSAGLTACLALLCHRLTNVHDDRSYFLTRRDDILKYLLKNIMDNPALLIDRTNFTFTWACICMLNSVFNFDFTHIEPAVTELDRELERARRDPTFSNQFLQLHWGKHFRVGNQPQDK
jgi:hypothetical protein